MTTQASEFVERALVSRGVWAPELKGKTAIVTGAGRLRSIGRPIALEFARQGVNVVLTGTGRSPDRYPPDEKEVGWRDIEIVANNAGAARGDDRVPVVDLDIDTWRKVIDVNLNGTFLACRAAARHLIAQGEGGCILNISSIASRLAGASAAAYSSSKAGINALSHALALELAPHQIRVNAVLPGVIDTARMDDLGREDRWRATLQRIPLGTAGTGMEIAYLCTYLCSDMGAWITGQDLTVDGGMTWH